MLSPSFPLPRRLTEFLETLPSVRARHSGRELLDHLEGTYAILANWESPPHVCHAGLFHSIYGTKAFPLVSLDESARALLRQLIGDQAEALVYAFHLADWNVILRDPDFAKQLSRSSAGIFEIAIANLVEQVPRLMRMGQDREAFLNAARMHRTLEPWLSDAAVRSLRELTDAPNVTNCMDAAG